MNAETLACANTDANDLQSDIDAVCARFAPVWPLDRFIAVNPWWGWVDSPFVDAAAELSRLNGVQAYPDRTWFAQAWQAGRIDRDQLRAAASDAGYPITDPEALVAELARPAEPPSILPLPSDYLDQTRDLRHMPAWSETITQQISHFCAEWFDTTQADWHPAGRQGFYCSWRDALARDRGTALLMGDHDLCRRAAALDIDPDALIANALNRLDIHVPDERRALMLTTLVRINGWASWCAYRRWQARLQGGDDTQIKSLLAIRLAWEHLLDDGEVRARWRRQWMQARSSESSTLPLEAVWLDALERSYRGPLIEQLSRHADSTGARELPAIQAFFCIDVRSEVFRRALEKTDSRIETHGFAGFFGLPISYTPLGGTAAQPLAPGLLQPTLAATDTSGSKAADAAIEDRRRQQRARRAGWTAFARAPVSAFTLVETLGLGYLGKLLTRSLAWSTEVPDNAGRHDAVLRPRLTGADIDDPALAADHAERVLRGMSLTRNFAPVVLLVGHASSTVNNPQAAGLDCGACCGHSGEINARALASLLNDKAVRRGLAERGIDIPSDTLFVPALHDTTTDRVALRDADLLPGHRQSEIDQLTDWLAQAGDLARRERAPTLDLAHLANQPKALKKALDQRSLDWAQTRPEWGLADNAAFIAAPRARTRGIDLGGRAFLHAYDPASDGDGSVLTLILTAPMIVAHWINLQYYASTVDNLRYGSGNKVLHNIVGGGLGVFEGNGGDLRIGLAKQSIHDGTRFRHTPQRMTVFVEAPRDRLDAVIDAQPIVRQLVDNQWIQLLRIEPAGRAIERCMPNGGWQPVIGPEMAKAC